MALLGEQGNLLENKVDLNNYMANYDQSLTLDMPYKSENKQLITMPAGYDYFHSLVRVGKYLFAATRDAVTPRLIRFNNLEDLSNYTVVTLPYKCTQLTYIRGTNKLYIAYFPADSSSVTNIRIGLIDIETLALSLPIDDPFPGSGAFLGPWALTIATDETNLYVLTANNQSSIVKYSLSNHARVSSLLNPNWGRGHGLMYDGTHLYATANQTLGTVDGNATSNWVLKVDPVTMTLIDQHNTFGSGGALRLPFTDDICSAGDYLYLGIDANHTGATFSIVKMSKLNMANYETIVFPGIVGNTYGTYFDGKYVWVLFATNPGKIAKIDTFTGELYMTELPAGEQSPNELVIDGKRAFIAYWQAPAKFARYSILQFTQIVRKMSSVLPLNFADDASAAAGGVPIEGIYHTSGILKIRLT